MHTFRREEKPSGPRDSTSTSSETSEVDHELALKETDTIAAVTQPNEEVFIEETHPTTSTSDPDDHRHPIPVSPPDSDQSETQNSSDDLFLKGTNIITYTGIDKRDGLTTIARRLLRDVPLSTSISLQKSLHPQDRVSRASDVGLGTVGLSAFMLNALGNPNSRRELVKEMWESGADVLVSLFLFQMLSASLRFPGA